MFMKPYGLGRKITGSKWKKDYHLHDKNHRKIGTWWEDLVDYISRRRMKQDLNNKINNIED